jgi:hypothetical protein
VGACARQFAITRNDIGADFASLWRILSAGRISADKCVALVGGLLGNPAVERLSVRTPLRAGDLLGLSVDAVDGLLSSAAFRVESEDALLDCLLKLGAAYSPLLRHIQPAFLSADGLRVLLDHLPHPPESVWLSLADWLGTPPGPPPPRPGPFSSMIVADFPQIFAEFRGKRFSLLWRGSRDGFGGRDFHSRCDLHANTLTVILDTNGNVFGGFTPVAWESRTWNGKTGNGDNCSKADDSLRSFVFTLKNPHNIPASRFALKAEEKWRAICCDSTWGPRFGGIGVSNSCTADDFSWTDLRNIYTNDTGLDEDTVFTGSWHFRVKEIEVFEITE